jgi:hypothetical protein
MMRIGLRVMNEKQWSEGDLPTASLMRKTDKKDARSERIKSVFFIKKPATEGEEMARNMPMHREVGANLTIDKHHLSGVIDCSPGRWRGQP